jgi:hypothetical protein
MLGVIGTSFSAEYILKAMYENTIGKLSEWTSGLLLAHRACDARHLRPRARRDVCLGRKAGRNVDLRRVVDGEKDSAFPLPKYADFVHVRPFYEFHFARHVKPLPGVYRRCFDAGPTRRALRRDRGEFPNHCLGVGPASVALRRFGGTAGLLHADFDTSRMAARSAHVWRSVARSMPERLAF